MSLLLLLHPQTGTDEAEAIARWPRHAEEIEWFIQTYDRLVAEDPPSS